VTHSFKLSRRIARLRAPVLVAVMLTAAACNSDDPFTPDNNTLTPPSEPNTQDGGQELTEIGPSLATSFDGGIPMGLFHLPSSDYGSRYNGGVYTPGTSALLSYLQAARARGGKVMLSLSGSQKYYKDAAGHFSLSKWKARIDRFRTVNFAQYINDGTVIGHYLIDEPYDAHNFAGQKVSASTLDEMARYSKQIWPGMATVVRAEPYLIPGSYRYLDAAWAQYLVRKGNVNDYIKRNVSTAQNMGLALVVGLNVPDGGTNNGVMTPSQVQNFGSTLLGSSYPCAFVSWKYGPSALETSGMKSAMDALRRKAENRTTKSCRG